MDLLAAARRWAAAGCSVIPVTTDGTKAPAVAWKVYQTTRADDAQLVSWFAGGTYEGLGVVCGEVSGGLELLEVEGRAVVDTLPMFRQALTDNGFGALWDRLNAGYLEQSPSGGLHWLYRVDGAPAARNLKLARRPANAVELGNDPADKVKVLLETRGEGGYVVVAPSGGRTHHSGKPWRALIGDPSSVPTISAEDRDALYAVAAMFDQMPVPEPVTARGVTGDALGNRPGDDFNARASWDEVLDGWTRTRRFGGNCHGWVRPGKRVGDGISATTGRNDGDNLYVFSSSTEFEPERPYSKFAAYALLNHGGDYSAAASTLRGLGYGSPPPEPARPADATEGMDHEPTVALGDVPAPPVLTYSATDDGNALRLVDAYADRVRYCANRAAWLSWSGQRWVWGSEAVEELARVVARGLPTGDKAADRHRHHSLSWRGLSAMVRIARTDPRVQVAVGDLDAAAYELNTPGGVVDLWTGKLHEPDPAKLHTRTTTVTPEFGAEPARWLKFLADTFAGDPALTTYVQRLFGLSLIGAIREPILPFGVGEGANGKSTLMNVAQGILGFGEHGYAATAPAELLIATTHRGHPTEIARLSGVRLVVASELEEGERFAEARVKMLTGNDQLAGRFMGKDFFSFDPTHTIWLLGNDQPAIRSGGPALWRRLRLVRFLHVVPEAERVAGLDRQLIDAEGAEILAWMVAGAVDYLRDGLAEPDSVRVATHEYEADQDTVGRFVADMCETGNPNAQHMTVRVGAVRSAYERWCAQEGETPVTVKAFTQALRRRFAVRSTRDMHGRFYTGIRLNDTAYDDTPSSE